jgi:predicted HicB family RNase H-like nuclease
MSQRKQETVHESDSGVLNLRDVPRELVASLKAAAAFARKPLKQYVVEVLEGHVEELERKGQLPKPKN